jgi:acyl-CoA thioester hydrolase
MSQPSIRIPVQLRWSDFDANYHLRHSAYYDFGAMARIEMLSVAGLTDKVFQEHGFGPILFREECVFRQEVKMHDSIFITCELLQCKPNGARFAIRHHILKSDNSLAATLTVWGDWIDFRTRKLWHPLPFLAEAMAKMPRHPEFNYI